MKLPRMTARHAMAASFDRGSTASPGAGAARRPQIVPMVAIGCLEGCVGSEGARACAHCGNDIACWSNCAGANAVPCVTRCYGGT